jgi:anti-sigma regulatory factor (Ser/Thr protein kinase)
MPSTLSLTLANRRDEISRLATALEAFGADAGIPHDVMFRVTLALDEIVSNVMRYAYPHADPRTDPQQIVVRVSSDQGVVTAVVEDTGVPFDPLGVPPPDLDASIDDRPIGGLGMHLVRSVSKSAEYSREGDRNVLRVTVGPSQ